MDLADSTGFNEAAGIPRGRRGFCRSASSSRPGFNEAAGIPRGRLGVRLPAVDLVSASMRPRVFPAEDRFPSLMGGDSSTRFNEAAGIPRGRR